MQIGELQALAKGVPEIFVGRKFVSTFNYRRSFEIDAPILVTLIPKMITKEDGSQTQMVRKDGVTPIYDTSVTIGFVGSDGVKYFTRTRSPLVYRLVKNLPVEQKEQDRFGNDLIYYEKIEGKLVFGQGEYKYGDKVAPVVTLEEYEE